MYLLIQGNERDGPGEKRAQTINIDFIISRLVLTKSYFPRHYDAQFEEG